MIRHILLLMLMVNAAGAQDRAPRHNVESGHAFDSAAARRDITGGRLPEPVAASALRPREVDYRRLSDEQILEM